MYALNADECKNVKGSHIVKASITAVAHLSFIIYISLIAHPDIALRIAALLDLS